MKKQSISTVVFGARFIDTSFLFRKVGMLDPGTSVLYEASILHFQQSKVLKVH
ncbi:MAG: hypothetical protein ACLVEJ_09365 [Parabacteroides sp.]